MSNQRPKTRRRLPLLGLVALFALLATAGCAKKTAPQSTIIVPSTATSAPQYLGDGAIPHQRYVVRMSDGHRDWEVEFPEVATGYEMRIPLKEDGTPTARAGGVRTESQSLTAADKELIEHMRRTNPDMERQGIYQGDRNVLDGEADQVDAANRTERTPETAPAPTRPRYLLGIEEGQKLFRQGSYELSMVKIVDLERAYPNDVRILSMKGTLWIKLGRPELARETWEKVLRIDPQNQIVMDALGNLNRAEGQ